METDEPFGAPLPSLLITKPTQKTSSWTLPDAEIQIIREDASRPARGVLLSSLVSEIDRRGDWIDGRKINFYALIRDLLQAGDLRLRDTLWWNSQSFDRIGIAELAGPHPYEFLLTSMNIRSVILESITLHYRHLRYPTPDVDRVESPVSRPRFTIVIRDSDAVGKSIVFTGRCTAQTNKSFSRWLAH